LSCIGSVVHVSNDCPLDTRTTALPRLPTMPPIEISLQVARRYIMGRQGLWPGRRWQGLDGAGQAMRAMEDLQLDPLVVVARAHDLALHARVVDYTLDDWAIQTYDRHAFFEWGGWLAVRPMEDLPTFRMLMRREREQGHWQEVERDHADTIDEMRALLRSGREVSNRDFAMAARTRIDHYRGRKDSALALHYLWRVGEAMVARRVRFERVYAATEAVAPAWALSDIDDRDAGERLILRGVAAEGLTRLSRLGAKIRASAAELDDWGARSIDEGRFVEIRVEGWKSAQLALASDTGILSDLAADRIPASWAPAATTTEEEVTFLSPLDPVSARGRAKAVFGFDYVWEVYKPVEQRRFGYYTMPILWGDRLVGRIDPKLDRSTGTLVILGLWLEDAGLARDAAFADALRLGMGRLVRLTGARRLDVAGVPFPPLRKRLRAAR
jgi:uncharacterized protein